MDIITLKQIEDSDLIPSTESSYLDDSVKTEWKLTSPEKDDIVKVSWEENGSTPLRPVRLYQKTTSIGNNYPPDDNIGWSPLGPTNKWAMFDQTIMTSSEGENGHATSNSAASMTPPPGHSFFTVKINTSNANRLCFFNLSASYLGLQFQDGASGVLYDYTSTRYPTTTSIDYDPYEFPVKEGDWKINFLGESADRQTLVIEIPEKAVSYVRITIASNIIGRTVSCGQCVWGHASYIGVTQYGATANILSYGRKVRNESYGGMYLKPGNNAKKMNIDVLIENTDYNNVYDIFEATDGIPCVFQGNNDEEGYNHNYTPFIIYGFTKSFSMILQHWSQSNCNLEVEGLI